MNELLPFTPERKLRYEGANYTADAVVLDPQAAKVLLIQRGDTGDWALPGGFIDPIDESSSEAAAREAEEEAGIALPTNAPLIFRGKVDDPRNSANAWIETSAHFFAAPSSSELSAGDDADATLWCSLTELPPLYGSHRKLIEHGLDYLDSEQLLSIITAPDGMRRPVEGGYMQYDKWITQVGDDRAFVKRCPADNHRSDELFRYIEKEAGIMAHLRQSGFRHLPQQSLLYGDKLVMDAIRSEDGWHWQTNQNFIDTYLKDVLGSFSELEAMPLPPSAFGVEDSYDSFTKEGWQMFDDTTHEVLADKYRTLTPHLSLSSQVTAEELLVAAPALGELARTLPEPEEFVFCHHDIRQSNFAWRSEEGIKIIDWSWAGPGLSGSDATSLLIDLHKSGYDVSAYHDYVNPRHCLDLIGFWLTRSTMPSHGAEGLREQQFISALSAYELLRGTWPTPASGHVDLAYADTLLETAQPAPERLLSQMPDESQLLPAA